MGEQLLDEMNQLLTALSQIRDELGNYSSTLQSIAQLARVFFNADTSIIVSINPITGKPLASLVLGSDQQLQISALYRGIPAQEERRQHDNVLLYEDIEEVPEYRVALATTEQISSLALMTFNAKKTQKPLGQLHLYFKERQLFNADKLKLFLLFANQVSLILKEAWLLQRYQVVARIGQEINQKLATTEILVQNLKQYIGDILDIQHAFLLADYQPQTNTIDVYLEEEGKSVRSPNHPLIGACDYVIQTQEKLFIRHYSQENHPFKIDYITGTGHEEAFIYVPLVFRDVPLGVLSIQHLQPDVYDLEDVSILELLANHVVLALHNMRLYNSLDELNTIGQLLTQQPDAENVLQDTADKIRDATKGDIVVLYPYSLNKKHFLTPHISGALKNESSRSLMSPTQPDDIAFLILQSGKTHFATNTVDMYNNLLGENSALQDRFVQRENIQSNVAIPLLIGNYAVGVLFINFRLKQHFDATRRLFIEGLAHYVAIALQNAQAFDEMAQRRLREQKIIQNIDHELSRFLDLRSILETSLSLTNREILADEAAILLYDKQREILEVPVALGPNAEERKKKKLSPKEVKAITLEVLEKKKPALVHDVHKDPRWRDLYFSVADKTIAELDVPLLYEDEVIGVLNLESYREKAFDQKDLDFLMTLAGQIVVAIRRAQAYERENRLAKGHKALNDISRQIIGQLSPNENTFDLILKKALELTNSSTGTLELFDADRNDLWIAAGQGVDESKKSQRLTLDEGVVGWVAKHKQPLNVDPSLPEWSEVYVASIRGTRSELAVPMLEGGEVRGVINIESAIPDSYTDDDVTLLQNFANLAVVALQNVERVKERQEAELKEFVRDEMRSVGESAFELTHQLGNDLGLVETYVSDIRSELVAQGVIINEIVDRKLRNISRAVRNTLEMSGRMKSQLAQSRLDDAQADAPSALSPRVLLEEVQAMVSLPALVQMSIYVEPDVTKVWVIHNLVLSILNNLISNAIDAMPNGGSIRLSACNEGNEGRFVALRVEDTGIGIPEQRIPKIFDLLFSTKNSSGFGLWSARRNALRNHGDISVEKSSIGQGTTFKLLLPRADKSR